MSLDYKQIFVDQYTQHIKRRGADRLLEWLLRHRRGFTRRMRAVLSSTA